MPHDPISLALIAYGAVLLVGIVQGCRDRIVVFADLQDLLVTFSILGAAAVALFLIVTELDTRPDLRDRLIRISIILPFVAVGYRALEQNGGIWRALLATLTKLPFAAAVPLLAIQLLAPTGKTASERASRRASALLLLTIVAPLMLALVRDKAGMKRYLGVA